MIDSKVPSNALNYALRLQSRGGGLSVCLLLVDEESPASLRDLESFTPEAARRDRKENALTAAADRLRSFGIEFSTHLRCGRASFCILDAAEELLCDEIVVAAHRQGVLGWIGRDIEADLVAASRVASIIAADEHGVPVG